jgi:four helix bundle protein
MIGEELRNRARQFALDTIDLCVALGDDELCRLIRPQLLRAATGVAANYRAACRARSAREFASRLAIVVEETDEAEFWLDVITTKRPGAPGAAHRLHAESKQLRAVFSASRRTVLSNLSRSKRKDVAPGEARAEAP